MSLEKISVHQKIEDIVDGTEYDAVTNGKETYLEDSNENQFKIVTRNRNPSYGLQILAEELCGIEFSHSYARKLRGQEYLRNQNILDDGGRIRGELSSELVEDIFHILSDDIKDMEISGSKLEKPEKEGETALYLQDYENNAVNSKKIAEETDLNTKEVSKVMTYWEKEYDLDPETYRLGGDLRTTWNTVLLEKEGVLEEVIDRVLS